MWFVTKRRRHASDLVENSFDYHETEFKKNEYRETRKRANRSKHYGIHANVICCMEKFTKSIVGALLYGICSQTDRTAE